MLTKSERTKQFILETAAPIFNKKGISGTSIDDLLEASKLTKGCIYGHFDGKEDLALQAVNFMLENNGNRLMSNISRAKSARASFFRYLDFYKDPLSTYIDGGCPVINMAAESDDNHPMIREKVAVVLRRGQELFVSILKQGIKDGEFNTNLDPAIYAFKAVSAVEGAIIICRSLGTAKPMQGLLKSLKTELDSYKI
ncbi:TetR/AcrR family transcriptional regulator [Pedobacter sp. NJ-S-72]